jgi:RDD family
LFGALLIASIIEVDHVARVLGVVVVLTLLLYEPILVSTTGSTIGHYFANLRVVDDRHHGNVNFLKAVARHLIKSVLGWYSFITMAATRRNQALHDQLTRSTVQIRDRSKALPWHYITERTEFGNPNMPSRTRRVVAALIYLLLAFVLVTVVEGVPLGLGVFSPACIDRSYCSAGERWTTIAVAVIWLIGCAWIAGLGWRGKFFGARLRAGNKSEPPLASAVPE